MTDYREFDRQTLLLMANAMARTDEAIDSTSELTIPKTHKVIGVVPLHIRHLCNLQQKQLEIDWDLADEQGEQPYRRYHLMMSVFQSLIRLHANQSRRRDVKIGSNWQLAVRI